MAEWDQRLLCPDGSCVGVIGDDGTCRVCGRVAPNWGEERTRGLAVEAGAASVNPDDEAGVGRVVAEADDLDDDDGLDDDDDEPADDESDEDAALRAAANDLAALLPPGAEPAWDQRTLCPDGACVGVIGADGRCKVCGTAP